MWEIAGEEGSGVSWLTQEYNSFFKRKVVSYRRNFKNPESIKALILPKSQAVRLFLVQDIFFPPMKCTICCSTWTLLPILTVDTQKFHFSPPASLEGKKIKKWWKCFLVKRCIDSFFLFLFLNEMPWFFSAFWYPVSKCLNKGARTSWSTSLRVEQL